MFEKILLIPAFKDNYIWLLVRDGRAAVVDPGDPLPVMERLEALGLQLETILITHHHADHQGGVAALSMREETARRCHLRWPLGPVSVMAVPGHTLGHLAYYVPGALFCGDTLFGAGCGRLFEGTPAQMSHSLAQIAALPDDTLVYCAHEYTEATLRFAIAVEPLKRQW